MNRNAKASLEMLSSFIGKTVVFNDFKEEDFYSEYIQPRMMADVVVCDIDCDSKKDEDCILLIVFDFSKHEEHNKQFETKDFYDEKGIARLSCREAGYYSTQEKAYIGIDPANWPFEWAKKNKLIELYQKRENKDLSYVNFLEGLVQLHSLDF